MVDKTLLVEKVYNSIVNNDNLEMIIVLFIIFLIRFIVVIGIFLISRRVINFLMNKYEKINGKTINRSLKSFSGSILRLILNLIVIIICLLILGVKGNVFVGLLGGAGLGIGLAMKDTISNFAGGIILIVFKAYEIGDFIEIDGQSGSVHEINVFGTILNTIDNKRILVPNGLATSHQIINYTKNKMRRIDILFGIAYDADFKKAINILSKIANEHSKISQKIEKTIRLKELGDSSVNITFRAWCKSEDYWSIYYDVMEEVKTKFDAEGINIPFPQMDVHLHELDKKTI